MNMLLMKLVKLIMLLKQTVNESISERKEQRVLFVLGGKVVDTRCHEYKDEPGQNVVKFLGIPIVHMSKQPDIIIKVCSLCFTGEEYRWMICSF